MKSKSRIRNLLIFLVALAIPVSGIAKNPDFTGTWNLNKEKSKLNQEFSFAPRKMVITKEGNALTATSISDWQGEEYSYSSTYKLDGSKSVNEGFDGSETVSVATWSEDGQSLSIETTLQGMDGSDIKVHSTYRIVEKMMMIDVHVSGGQGDMGAETWAYSKE
jgi:hypothetical protein